MILSNVLSSATSSSIHGSERLPEIAKSLAPYVQWTLEKFRHEDELWLDFFTGLVVLGVALEVVEIIHELREKFGPFKIRKAAEVLSGELTSDLPPHGQNQNVLIPVAKPDPKMSALVKPEWDLPRSEVSRYPEMIVILVGSQPSPQRTRLSSAKRATKK
jgi:hypothetical protein